MRTLTILFLILFCAISTGAAQTLKVGVYHNPPLVSPTPDGRADGLFIDLLETIAARQGWQLNYYPGSWSDCLARLETGEIDLLPAIAHTPERAERYDFTEETVLSNWGQIYLHDDVQAETILDLDGKTVVVKRKDVYYQGGQHDLISLVKNFGIELKYVEVDGYREAFEILDSGLADAALVSRIYGSLNHADYNIEQSPILLSPIEVRLAFAQGMAPLRQQFDSVLRDWKTSQPSLFYDSQSKWLDPHGSTVTRDFTVPQSANVVILFILCGTLVFLRHRNRSASRELKQKDLELKKQREAQKTMDREMIELKQQYHVLFEENRSAMLLIDPDKQQIVDGNKAACLFYGYERVQLAGTSIADIAADQESRDAFDPASLMMTPDGHLQGRHRLGNGTLRDVEMFTGPMSVGGRSLLCSIIHDITERLGAERELANQRDFLQSIIDGVVEPLMVIAPDFRVLLMNKVAAQEVPNRDDTQALFCHQISHDSDQPCHGDDHPCPVLEVQATGKPVTMIHNHKAADGSTKIVELYASPLWNDDGSLFAVIEGARDITARLEAEELLSENQKRLNYLAHHDPLTALPNRLLFDDRLERALAMARRKEMKVALLFLDLDRFKNINDTLGHGLGDQLLKGVGERLLGCVRETDTVARLGGDEFLVILDQVQDFQMVTTMAQRIRHGLAQDFTVDGHQLFITASIGISLFPMDAQNARELMKCADIAMYHAKQEGKDNYQFYRPELNRRVHEMLDLERGLRKALNGAELELYYQPQFELETGQLTGMEALLRWWHPERGMVSPSVFVPIAEETGLIVNIGEWVLREACQQICAWQDEGLAPPRVAVNLSGRQLRERDFIDVVDQVLIDTDLDPRWLELEITEGILMENVQENILTMAKLQARGIDLSIDDFGTGYSSLSYLSRFPVSTLKIDQSFVGSMLDNREQSAIVDSILALGKSLNLKVIAEGIESEAQHDFLNSKGCHQGQGHLFGEPLPAAQFRDQFLVANPELFGSSLPLPS
ncbi:MAG: PAS domain S-box protein [Desulfuromonas sp.]|nr:MAG: PAS domain S-box protein [Desulfuromonas sp.]